MTLLSKTVFAESLRNNFLFFIFYSQTHAIGQKFSQIHKDSEIWSKYENLAKMSVIFSEFWVFLAIFVKIWAIFLSQSTLIVLMSVL